MRAPRQIVSLFAWAIFILAVLTVVGCGPPPSTGDIAQTRDNVTDSPTIEQSDAVTDDENVEEIVGREVDREEPADQVTPGSLATDANGVQVGFTEDGYPFRGNPDATIVIEEYSDYQCPFCARFYAETLPSLITEQVANGEAMIIYRDFPLESIHPQAVQAANAARCAGEQGAVAYWMMHDALFENLNRWSNNGADKVFLDLGREIDLNMESFAPCMTAGRYEEEISDDISSAISLGLNSTPSFFINGQLLVGAQPLAVFEEAMDTVQNGGSLASTDGQSTTRESQPSAAPTPASFRSEVAGALGDPDAPVTIVEFTDYQCPFCARHSLETLPTIMTDLIESGRVYYVLKDFPLDQLHPNAREAANAARCAGDQGGYWAMHHALFEGQAVWADAGDNINEIFVDYARDQELDIDQFGRCIESGQFAASVESDVTEGLSLGVNSTPFFFIDGYPLSGARPIEHFQIAVELAEAGRLAEIYVPREPEPAVPAEVDTEGAYGLGRADAPITIVEFSDYQCPFCARHFQQTYPRILENYVDKGIVRYVFKDFPLSIHPQADEAAEAARCAGDQDAYFAMHDLLFENQSEWSNQNPIEIFVEYASTLGLESGSFRQCLTDQLHSSDVQADLRQGLDLGVSGTPAFFINGYPVSGAQPFELFENAIEQLLAQLG